MGAVLLLMRHGKSDWDAAYDHDIDRPLKGRGRKAARRMGRFLSATGNVPDLAITSPARRAGATLALALEAGGMACPVEVADAFYDRTPAELIDHLRTGTVGSPGMVLAVGHEPTWSASIESLTGARVRFPTGAVARVDLAIEDWPQLRPGAGELAWLVTPRLLGRAGSAEPGAGC